MKQLPAIGLVETRGLIGAIEAADAMCKAANVKLIGREKTNPALITVQIIGETAAVKTAVEAGAAAAARVGELVSTHVIPRPDLQLETILTGIVEKEPNEVPEKKVEVKPIRQTSIVEKEIPKVPKQEPISVAKQRPTPLAKKASEATQEVDPQLMDIKVTDLRTIARATVGFPIKGREISKANKEELLRYFAQIDKG